MDEILLVLLCNHEHFKILIVTSYLIGNTRINGVSIEFIKYLTFYILFNSYYRITNVYVQVLIRKSSHISDLKLGMIQKQILTIIKREIFQKKI